MLFKSIAFASALLQLSVAAPTQFIAPRDPAVTGSGIMLCNQGTLNTQYCFYNNFWNGDGTAGANFDKPQTCLYVGPAGQCKFVPLESSFKGRVQRGTCYPNTWAEFQLSASNDGFAHGDISVEQGNDGPATIESTDGSSIVAGFTKDAVPNAPEAAKYMRADGLKVIDTTMGNWNRTANAEAISYQQGVIPSDKVYITGGTGVDDLCSHNNAMKVTFY